MNEYLTEVEKVADKLQEVSHELDEAKKVLPSEALFMFAAWLTSRRVPLTVGASCNAAPICEMVAEFIEHNDLKPLRDEVYPHNLSHPPEEGE